MEVQKDFQLLDDDDDMSSSSQIMSKSLYDSSSSNATLNNKIIKSNNNNNTSKISNSITNLDNSDILISRPRPAKYNISSNNPNANNANKLEIKSIERPRSHSPLKMKGIEEYIQLYANNNNNKNITNSININQTANNNAKITMNLKMDDLLANVKNDSNSYQTLADFSFMTGDSDLITDGPVKPRRRSLQNSNLKDDDWLNNKINNLKELNNNEKKSDNEADNDDDDDNDDDNDENYNEKNVFTKENNLNYKYTATYRKDEATGSFQEQSKIVFESKLRPKQITSPPAVSSSISKEIPNTTADVDQSAAKLQIANALEALYSNSKKLESKLDKIEDIRPSSNTYINMLTPEPDENDSKKISNMNNIFERSVTDLSPGSGSVVTPVPPPPAIRKKNDSFFNEFLSKSDDLIAQTQFKLEKLSKLETITKPLAPKPTNLALNEKVKPAVSNVIPEIITTSVTPVADTSQTIGLSLNNNNNKNQSAVDINNSKSLIDLKSLEQITTTTTTETTTNTTTTTNPIDLLFDDNENSYSLTTEPLKQRDSYFDLIGISKSDSSNLTEQKSQPIANSILNVNSRSNSPYRDDLLDNLLGNQSDLMSSMSNNNNTTSKLSNDYLNSLYSNNKAASAAASSSINESIGEEIETTISIPNIEPINIPNIDILITEPMNEKDDNSVVPEGFFNIYHEKPNDQSRPHSPIELSNSKPSTPIKQAVNIDLDLDFFINNAETVASSLPTPPQKAILPPKPAPPPPPPPTRTAPSVPTILPSSIQQQQQSSSSSKQAPMPPPSPSISIKPKRPVFVHSPEMVRSRPKSRPPSRPASRPHSPPQEQQQYQDHSSNKTSSKNNENDDIMNSILQLNNALDDDIFNLTNKKTEEKLKKKKEKTNKNGESSSSSDDDDDDDIQKFQIKINPRQASSGRGRSTSNSNNPSDIESDAIDSASSTRFIPLLPRPPETAREIEEFRRRRTSSGAESITTRSIRENQSSDEEQTTRVLTETKTEKTSTARKESVQSEFNLELPDADDSQPLSDFNDKCELTFYPDGFYGCMVLVRQPFRNANLMYKNAFQKLSEVRTWTECLVKLVDSPPNGKKLAFYNAHELLALAAENDTTLENIISTSVKNEIEKNSTANVETSLEPEDDNNKTKKVAPFHEIELKASFKFSEMCLQQFDTYTKIHTFKIQEIIYQEGIQVRPDRLMALPGRFMKRFTKTKVTSLIDHTPIPFEICKFGHLNFAYLRSFLLLLQDAFWTLPTITRKLQREQQLQQIQSQPVTAAMSITAAATSIFSFGSNKQIQAPTLTSVTTHLREEITVKLVDEYKCKLNKEGHIVEHRSRTRVFLTIFVNSPEPKIEIGLNDCLRHGKEIVSRHEIVPIKTEQWIAPEIFELNENVVDKEEFEKTHCLRCVQMPDNLLVEIMRFRTRPRRNYELPLQVRCYMSLVGRACEIRIECTVAGTYYTKLNEVHCEDIQIRFPLPDVWVYLFRVEKRFRYGAVHSSKHKFGKIKGLDRFMVHKGQNQGALMEASCGMAKYEQAFKSVVWRIEQLPVKNKDIYKTHLFICKFNLQEYDNLPEKYEPIAKIQYSIPVCAASKSQVRSISLSPCEDPPEKWVKLKSKFEYDLDINYLFDQKELPLVDKENCAELQHLTVTESEGDNNEEDDNDD